MFILITPHDDWVETILTSAIIFAMSLFGFIFSTDTIMEKCYYTYFLTNKNNTVLYTGITGNLKARIYQYKTKMTKGFTCRYNVDKLVYVECYDNVWDTISREKQIKAGSRQGKIDLINGTNPELRDLYDDVDSE